MNDSLRTLLPLLAPALLYAYALWVLPNRKKAPGGEWVSAIGILTALVSGALVFQNGPLQSGLLGFDGLGFSIRIDALSISMLTMIALLGFVILKFSRNYLDGDPRQHLFFSRLATTIASVELLVLSGNLVQILAFWAITSICLHYLLVFYRNRPQAIAAARKKFIVARLGDVSLFTALALIYTQIGTGDLDGVFESIRNMETLGPTLTLATVLLVVAALLKSAQFPSHGWLIEVVETPTPVSALLHAGLLNAGPFLMVRMSPMMIESTPASLLLIGLGGFTALFASVVYLTQPTVKVALGYSSVAHMGFSLLVCGLGVYPAAILHVVAHSFYKAHSFLSTGSVVDSVRARKVKVPQRNGSPGTVLLSIAAGLGIYVLFSFLWGVTLEEDFNLMLVGAIVVMGISQLLVNTLDRKNQVTAVLLSTGLAFGAALSFFALETGARFLLSSEVPSYYDPNPLIRWAGVGILAAFSLVILVQLLSPRLRNSRWAFEFGIHLRNGFYANVLFDRMIGSLKHHTFRWANLHIPEDEVESEDKFHNRSPFDSKVESY